MINPKDMKVEAFRQLWNSHKCVVDIKDELGCTLKDVWDMREECRSRTRKKFKIIPNVFIDEEDCPPPKERTSHYPGSPGKIEVMAERVLRGEQPFHPEDARDYSCVDTILVKAKRMKIYTSNYRLKESLSREMRIR